MYFQNLQQKQYIKNKLNSYQSVHKREVERLCLEEYRLHPNAKLISKFINDLTSVYIDYVGNIVIPPMKFK